MECQYKFKSGKNKNKQCLKQNCKNKKHNQIEELDKLFENMNIRELTIYDILKLLKNELQFIYENKIPTNIISINQENGDEEKTTNILKEEITFKDICAYCFYRYRYLRLEKSVGDFTKIICPINNYFELDMKLETLNEMSFIMLIGDIKSGF